MKTKQFKWLAVTLLLVAAMVMPSVAWAQTMYTVFDTATGTLTFKYDDKKPESTDTEKVYDIPYDSSTPGWYTNHASFIQKVVFDVTFNDARPQSCYAWFHDCLNLTTISGIENLNTEEVTDMRFMFRSCNSLTTLDLSGFNTAKVKYMSRMFINCTRLTTIFVSDKFTTSAVISSNNMFDNCPSLVGAIKYDPSKTDANYANMKDGYFTLVGTVAKPKGAYVVYTDADNTLTFKYGEIPTSTNTEKVYDIPYYDITPEWQKNHASSIQKVVFDVTFKDARPKSCFVWFTNCTSLTTISGIENLNTEEVTNMDYMFSGCKSLTTLDLSGFNTAKVERMNVMFYDCTSLTTIYVSEQFTTSAVTSSSNMFDNCPSLVGAIKYDDNIKDKTGANYATGYFSYGIKTADDLKKFAQYVNGTYTVADGETQAAYPAVCAGLMNDITMTENDNVAPIGSNEYTGTFDGRGHSICGLKINSTNNSLFANNSGTIKNLGVVNAAIASGSNGSICQTNSGTIENCFFAGTTEGTTSPSGAVCQTNNGTVTNCYYLAESETDVIEGTTAKTAAQFNSGEVAWLLNGSSSDGEWGQQLGTDDYPVWGGAKVYQCSPCTVFYSNDENKVTADHTVSYDNGFGICSVCRDKLNVYEPATQNKSGEYEIGNAGQLCWFAGLVNGTLTDGTSQNTNAKGVLTDNIDLTGISNWTPIGNAKNKFGGTFDGKNFKVQHMSITQQGNYTGLFGYASRATMKNICIDGNITLTTTSYTEGYGSIAGRIDNSTISNCHSSVNFTINTEMDASENCIGHIGGIVGKMDESESKLTDSNVSGCSYSGTINLGNKKVNVAAGIVGYAIYSDVPITNCRFTGTIHSECNDAIIIGGIFGYTRTNGNVKVTNCLQAGTLEKPGNTSMTGILIGQINEGYGANAVTKNYYTSSTFNVIGSTSGTPTTTPATQCSTKQLQSGEICYLLNSSSSNGGWGQKLGTDSYPVPGSNNTVYSGYKDCLNITYSNNPEELSEERVHHYDNGFGTCTVCGDKLYEYQPATLTTDKYDINGDNTKDNVYEIGNAGQLYWFAGLVNGDPSVCTGDVSQNTSANAVLIANITVNKDVLNAVGGLNTGHFIKWTPIGTIGEYGGIFDGQGHTIGGLWNTQEDDCIGLFGTNAGTIKNIGVVDSYLSGNNDVGGVCGLNSGSLTNCYNTGSVDGNQNVGGVCGQNGGSLANCYNTGYIYGNKNVSENKNVGGVCGLNGGSLTNCYNTGYINVQKNVSIYENVGGVCGQNGGSLTNCYNTGYILGYDNVGGVCGQNGRDLTNCYNTGYINGNEKVGGVCGWNNRSITNCYNTGNVVGFDFVGGVCGHIGSNLTNCYYLANEDDKNGGKEETQFKNGEVAYLLAQGCTVGGTFYDGSVWGQQIGTNDYPLIGSPYKVLRAARDGENGTNYWATFSNLNSNAELMASTGNVTVYNATVSAGTLTLTKRSDNKVAKKEGVLLKANCEYVNAKNISDEVSAAATEVNHLVATPATAETITAETGYTLYRLTYNKTATKEGLGFYLGVAGESKDGSQLKATPGKAYLNVLTSEVTEPSTAKLARGFAFPGDDDETTGIECITVTDEGLHSNGNAEGIFDLQGRKVSKPTKGVYIKNGKKVVINL